MLASQPTGSLWETDPQLTPVIFVTAVTIIVCVLLHFAAIWLMAHHLTRRKIPTFVVMTSVVLGLMCMHLVEIGVFAFAYQFIGAAVGEASGMLAGNYDGTLRDSFYFSIVVYTTVGFGDIIPEGPLRMLVGCEALTGLVLITWSASFTFLVMQSRWRTLTGHFVPHLVHDKDSSPSG